MLSINMANAKCSCKGKEETLTWTDSKVELLLECVKSFAADCRFEGKDCERIKSKYDKIGSLFVERYPNVNCEVKIDEEFPKSPLLDTITKERIAAKEKNLWKIIKKVVDLGKKIGGGRIVTTYYDLGWLLQQVNKCSKISFRKNEAASIEIEVSE